MERLDTGLALNTRIKHIFIDNTGQGKHSRHSFDVSLDYVASLLLNDLSKTKVIFVSKNYKDVTRTNQLARNETYDTYRQLVNRFGKELVTNKPDTFRWKKAGFLILRMKSDSFRGLDFPDVDAIVIESMPKNLNDYIHAAGRVGRGDHSHGLVITLINTQTDREVADKFMDLAENNNIDVVDSRPKRHSHLVEDAESNKSLRVMKRKKLSFEAKT